MFNELSSVLGIVSDAVLSFRGAKTPEQQQEAAFETIGRLWETAKKFVPPGVVESGRELYGLLWILPERPIQPIHIEDVHKAFEAFKIELSGWLPPGDSRRRIVEPITGLLIVTSYALGRSASEGEERDRDREQAPGEDVSSTPASSPGQLSTAVWICANCSQQNEVSEDDSLKCWICGEKTAPDWVAEYHEKRKATIQ